MPTPDTTILWFRQDLRLHDHQALAEAQREGGQVLPLYILDDETPGRWRMGGASRWWLHHSLQSLAADLSARGAELILRRGPADQILPALAHELGARTVHTSFAPEPWLRELDRQVAARLEPIGARLIRHRGAMLSDPHRIRTRTGGIYGIFTPFCRAVLETAEPSPPLPAPTHIQAAPARSDRLSDWALLPTAPDWSAGIRETWTPGETAARARLKHFLENAASRYATGRNLPGEDGTSRLSPHLHWGEISPNTAWHACRAMPPSDDLRVFIQELVWRDFSAYLLWHNPTLPEAPLRPEFAALPWRNDPPALRAWQRGRTGVPIVDAGMRQLWHTGWMHNRVRMIAASFLTKHLLIDWREGAAWFWDTLADADLASNSASWQWVAGTGIDSQPYFRVFNPVTQGQKFDPAGHYVRQWVPELRAAADKFVHAPWLCPEPPSAYPAPILDLAEGRRRALDVYGKTIRPGAHPP